MSQRDPGDIHVEILPSGDSPSSAPLVAPGTKFGILELARTGAAIVAAAALMFMAVALTRGAQADRQASCATLAQIIFFAGQAQSGGSSDGENATDEDEAADRAQRSFREQLSDCGADIE